MHISILRLFCLLVFVCVAVSAQLEAKVQVKFFFHKPPESAPTEVSVFSQGSSKITTVGLPDKQFSETYTFKEGGRVLYFAPRDVNFPLKPELLAKLPQVKLKKTDKFLALIVFSDPDNKLLPIRVEKISANSEVFGNGDFLFANFSNVSIKGSLKREEFVLKPKSSVLVEKPGEHLESIQLKLDKLVEVNGEKKMAKFARNIWRSNHKTRYVTFIDERGVRSRLSYYCLPLSF
ncbi:hypothetical protein ACFSQZ_10355 [Rubritalea spongiae]|uniref:Uncharacterized protein n=1 Tax=Rubritalea spongiae TaxID=430797 RepID=A0ABW5E2L9_9BACT